MREVGTAWRRHDLLRVAPEVWAATLAHCPTSASLPLVRNWADAGWPVIVRRRDDREDEPGLVPIGLPLPPSAGKRRIALTLSPQGILQRSSLPSLVDVASSADRSWRATIAALLALGTRTRVAPCAFGSLLWQHLTGLIYLSPQSDLDLLWKIPANLDVLSLISNIAEIQHHAPVSIDGEIVFPDGSAVSWRELWNAHRGAACATVLAKTIDGVRLFDIAAVLGVG